MRMSVITQNQFDRSYKLYTKGSPEKILELSHKHLIPLNFKEILEYYT